LRYAESSSIANSGVKLSPKRGDKGKPNSSGGNQSWDAWEKVLRGQKE